MAEMVINLKFADGERKEISIEEARQLYYQLKRVFVDERQQLIDLGVVSAVDPEVLQHYKESLRELEDEVVKRPIVVGPPMQSPLYDPSYKGEDGPPEPPQVWCDNGQKNP